MKLFALLALFLSIQTSGKVITIGEQIRLPLNGSAAFVEKTDHFSFQIKTKELVILGKKKGSAKIKRSESTEVIQVVTNRQMRLFKKIQDLIEKTPGLRVDWIDAEISISGLLMNWETWKKIRSLDEDDAGFFFRGQLSDQLQNKIQEIVDAELRSQGLMSVQIRLQPHLLVGLSPKQRDRVQYEHYFRKLGIPVLIHAENLQTEPTIKVKIKVLEMSKVSSQELGIGWPNQVQYRVLPRRLRGIDDLSVVISAHEAKGEIKTLASPNLISRSGEQSQFFAGGEYPIRLKGYRSEQVQWIKYGVGMKIKPYADSFGRISLSLETEVINVSSLVDGIPSMEKNIVNSHFDLSKKQVIAMGGLLRHQQSWNREGLPYLSRIPILGQLFSSPRFMKQESELVILVEPELMEN